MAIRVDHVYSIRKVNLVFATAAVALLASLIWWVKADYQRPWRQWQHRYIDMQAVLARSEVEAVRSPEYQKQLDEAREALLAANAKLEDEYGEVLADLRTQAKEMRRAGVGAELAYRQVQAELSVARARYEQLRVVAGESDPATERAKETLIRIQHAYDQVKHAIHDDAQLAIERQQEYLYNKGVTEARRRLEHLETERDAALRKKNELSSTWRRRLLNMPLFDFLVPKGTLGRTEIKEVVLPDIELDLHFARTQRTDRCMTCHVAVDDERFTKDNLVKINQERESRGKTLLPVEQPLLAHPHLDLFVSDDSPHPMQDMGCTVCHEGAGEETDFVLAGHTPNSPEQRQEWEDKYYVRRASLVPEHTFCSAEQRLTQPIVPTQYAAAGCTKCHAKVADIAIADSSLASTRINRGRFNFTSLGCANCHLVGELADARKVGTDLSHVGEKLTRGFVHHWTWRPKDFRPATRMPHSFGQENNDAASDVESGDNDPVLRTRAEVVAMTEYLLAASQSYERQFVPADLWETLKDENSGETVAAAERGRRLFDSLGCLGCHANLAHAPDDVDGIASDTFGIMWIGNDLADQMEAAAESKQGQEKLTDEDYAEIEDAAFGQAEQMTLAQQAEYARTHFDRAGQTIFEPDQLREPVFTRRAPELSRVRAKFADYGRAVKWLYDWLVNPRHYASDTVMPHMRLERKRIPEIDPRTFAKTGATVDADEALDLAIYLATLSDGDSYDTQAFDDRDDDQFNLYVKRNELAMLLLGKLYSDRRSEAIWQDEKGELTDWLIARLAKSLSRDEARVRTEAMDLDQRRWIFLGEQMIGHYGCYACHRIPGFEHMTGPGPEFTKWGQTPLSQLDFGFFDPALKPASEKGDAFSQLYPPDRKELIDWIGSNPSVQIQRSPDSFAWHKIRNPRIWDRGKLKGPYQKLKMPNFYLAEVEVEPLVSWLLSRKPGCVKETLLVDYKDTPAGWIADGRNLARDLNCVACHRIDGNLAVLDQYHRLIQGSDLVFDEINSPPALRGEGAKVRPDWLYGFIQNVDMLRPWLEVRMPQFDLTDEQATQLAAYFSGLSQDESHWLEKRLASLGRESQKSKNKAKIELRRYAVLNRLIPAPAVDPDQAEPKDIAAADRQIVEDAQFRGKLFDVPYPFAEPPPAEVAQDRLADGETIFFELQCLSCHVFGDPSLPGANAKPTSQNLELVHDRLQPRWVQAWMEAPGRIQPGTKMPSLFGNGTVSAFAEFKPEDRKRVRSQLNDPTLLDDGAAQIKIMSDFMYNTSANKQSKVQPGGILPDTQSDN